MLRMLDLFSGIGGFSYAGEKLVGGYETVAFCEYDKHAQKVLRKHWPDTEIIDDVRELANDADRFRGLADIVVGGYPCQPFSAAGKRRGDKDDRHLWPEMLRIIQAVRPTWVCGENVAGHISMGLDEVLSDLEAEGYQARCFVIPAVAADARHRRDRRWVIAHADREGEPASAVDEQRLERAIMGNAKRDGSSAAAVRGKPQEDGGRSPQGQGVAEQSEGTGRPRDGQKMARGARAEDVGNADSGTKAKQGAGLGGEQFDGAPPREWAEKGDGAANASEDVPNASAQGLQGDVGQGQAGAQGQSEGYPAQCRWWQPEPSVGRVANGVPGRVHRLKQLGNSIVPQVAARILWAIKEAHNG
jgi:DNA (cytosine-5)-methyltransferase 1